MPVISNYTIARRVFQALKYNGGALELHVLNDNKGLFNYGYRFEGDTDVNIPLNVILFQMRIDDKAEHDDEKVQFWPTPFTTEERLLHRNKDNEVCEFMEEQITTLAKRDFHNAGTLISTNQVDYNVVSVAAINTITEMFRSRRIAYQLSDLNFGSFESKPNREQCGGTQLDKILHIVIWRRYASRNIKFSSYKNSSRTGNPFDQSIIFTSNKYPCFILYHEGSTHHVKELMAINVENDKEDMLAINDPIDCPDTNDYNNFWEQLDNLYLRKVSEQLEISQVSELMGIEVNLMRTHLTDQTMALQLKNLTLVQIKVYVRGFILQHGYPFELINSGTDKIGLEAGTRTRWISITITKEIDGHNVPMDFPTDTPLSKFVIYTMDSLGGIEGLRPVQYVENHDTIGKLVEKIRDIINHYLDRIFLNPATNFPTVEDDEQLPSYSDEEEDHMSPRRNFRGGGRFQERRQPP